jgi:hypothetical protein
MSHPNQPIAPTPTSPQPTLTPAASAAMGSPPAITNVGRSGGRMAKLQLQAAYQALASGLQSTYLSTDTFNIHGETLSRDEVVARLRDLIATVEATKVARQQWRSAVQAEGARLVTGAALRQSLQGILQARLGGKAASGLAAFGFNPAKIGKRTVTSKATAIAKNAATRQARHTMGSVQKEAIKGNVTHVVITPVTASPSSALSQTSGAPAQSTSPTGSTTRGSNA